MARKMLFYFLLAGFFWPLVSTSFALEKLKWACPVKVSPPCYLPPLAAEDRGLWKENGLDGEWVPFVSGTPQMHAVAAASINIGMVPSSQFLTSAARGLPVVMVGELVPETHFFVIVRNDSPYRHFRDLKGKRVGLTQLGSVVHIYGQVIARVQGVEKDVRFVGAGGFPEMMAGLRTGAFEATVTSVFSYVGLKVEGVVREIDWAGDYLPKPWVENAIFVRKDFAQSRPDVVKKALRAIVQSAEFMRKNPGWTIDKMKSHQGLSEEAAKFVNDNLRFTTTGRLDRKAVENVRRVLIDYGILPEKAPAVDDLFTNEYLP